MITATITRKNKDIYKLIEGIICSDNQNKNKKLS